MTRSWRWLFALALLGCTRNAVLELELELPAQPAGDPLFAIVQARSDGSFDEAWIDEDPISAIPLTAPCTRPDPSPACHERMLDPECSEVVSIVADGDEIEAPLGVRVRFCTDPTCEDEAAPVEHRVEIERAFYLGRFTQARVCVDEVPSATNEVPEAIERCEVRCRDGLTAMHCRLDGTHFCE